MEISGKISKARIWMKENKVESLIVTNPAHQFYLSGFKAFIYSRPIILVIDQEETVFILPGLEEQHAKAEAKVDRLYVYHEYPEEASKAVHPTDLLKQHLARNHKQGSTIAFDLAHAPAALVEEIKDSGFHTSDASKAIMEMRYIKDTQELNTMKEAGKLVEVAVLESLRTADQGVSELEIDAAGTTALFSETAKKHPDATLDLNVMTPSGVARSTMPHVFSNTRKLKNGDTVIHSRQVGLNGYRAELERTFIVGEASEMQRLAFEAVVKAQQAALEIVKPGIEAKEVDLTARKILRQAGLEKYAMHRVGHAIGLSSHEEPYIRFDNSLKLEEGMVFCIEPGIYIPDVGGFRHSDTVIVTADGYELITEYPRDLASLII